MKGNPEERAIALRFFWQIYRSWIQCTVLRWHGAFFAAVNQYPWDNGDRADKGKYICRFRLEQLFFKIIQYLTI